MGERENAESVKLLYVEAAYAALQEGGIESVTARNIARRVGKTPPAVYRHFESMDYLIAVASIHYLKPYYADLKALAQTTPHALDFNLQAWECFAYYAFQNIPIFENLFFKDPTLCSRAMEEFFNLYPGEKENFQGYLTDLMLMGSLEVRERDFLRLAAAEGLISYEDADYLADCDVFLFQGMLQRYRNAQGEEDVSRKATRHFVSLVARTYSAALLPGYKLSFALLGRDRSLLGSHRRDADASTAADEAGSAEG